MTHTKHATTSELLRAPHVATAEVVEFAGHSFVAELYKKFREYNETFFDGALGAPLVLVTATCTARALGDYIERDVHGLSSRIRINPSTLKRGPAFVFDVLLHEMVHAWQHEIAEEPEPGYRGHGPVFAAKCNEIGEKLGLKPVGVKGRGGVPACNYWPHIVRPMGFYGSEGYEKPTRKPSEPKAPAPKAPQPRRKPEDATPPAERIVGLAGALAGALQAPGALEALSLDELVALSAFAGRLEELMVGEVSRRNAEKQAAE